METAWDLLAPPCTDQMSLLITRYVVAGSSFLIKGPEKIVRSDITPSFCFCSCCVFRLASQETLILEERKSITTENAASRDAGLLFHLLSRRLHSPRYDGAT